MIIDPDFLTHWKTRQLCGMIGENAPLAIIALWAHCQNRREDVFQFTPPMLAGVCHWAGDPSILMDALIDCGFLDELDGGCYCVHGWRERNKLITSKWRNNNASKSKPIENKLNSSRNQLETSSKQVRSNHILSNPILSNQEGESEREGEQVGGFGQRFDEVSKRLATINTRWKPHTSPQSRRDALEDRGRWEAVTDDDIAVLVKFYTAKHDDGTRLCQSLSALVSKLPDQVDRAHAWKAAKGRTAYDPISRPTRIQKPTEVDQMTDEEHEAARRELSKLTSAAFSQ